MQLIVPKSDGSAGRQRRRQNKGCWTMSRPGEVERTSYRAMLAEAAAVADSVGRPDFNGGGKIKEGQAAFVGNANDRRHQGRGARLRRALASGKKWSRTWLTA